MAKHQIDNKGKVSKGERRSCNKAGKLVNKPAITFAPDTKFLNAMQQAFLKSNADVAIVRAAIVHKAMKLAKNLGKGYSFTGRYRTRQGLIAAGYLPA